VARHEALRAGARNERRQTAVGSPEGVSEANQKTASPATAQRITASEPWRVACGCLPFIIGEAANRHSSAGGVTRRSFAGRLLVVANSAAALSPRKYKDTLMLRNTPLSNVVTVE